MADLEPGVVLSPSTVAAMERLSTSPRTAMTKQHKATTEQWKHAEACAPEDFAGYACILELRSRVEALETAQRSAWRPVATETTYGDARAAVEQTIRAPMVVEGTFEHGGETYRFKAKPERETAMDEPREASLVERVAWLIAKRFSESRPGTDCLPFGRDVIREVAAWLRSEYPRREGYGTAWANLIEQEANR